MNKDTEGKTKDKPSFFIRIFANIFRAKLKTPTP